MPDDEMPFFYVPPPDPMLGRRVEGSFVLISLLGRGGMGGAYLAEHEGLRGVQCVIKVILTHLVADANAIARFRNEAYAGQQLKHRNLVRLQSAGVLEDTRQWYLMFDYIKGPQLNKYVGERGGRLSLHDAAYILFQVCVACDYMHAHNVIHRDLKPDNILVVVDPSEDISPLIKIIDFGISKVQGSEDLTGSGMSMGTPRYMSPEQVHDAASAGPASDMFSVAVIAYELLTGELPWGRVESVVALYHKQQTEPPITPPEDLVPPGIWKLFQRCLSLVAGRRPDPRAFAIEFAREVPATDTRANGTQILKEIKKSWVESSPTYARTLPTNMAAQPRLPGAQAPLGHDGRLPPLAVVTVPPEPTSEAPVPEVQPLELTEPSSEAPAPEASEPEPLEASAPEKSALAPEEPVPEVRPVELTPIASGRGRGPARVERTPSRPSPRVVFSIPANPPATPERLHPQAVPVLSKEVLAGFATGFDSQKIVAHAQPAPRPDAHDRPTVAASEIVPRAVGTPGPHPYAHRELPLVILSTTQLPASTPLADAEPKPTTSLPHVSVPTSEPSERSLPNEATQLPPQDSTATLPTSGTTAEPIEPPQDGVATPSTSGMTAEPIESPHARAPTLQLVGATAEPIEPPQARAATLQLVGQTAEPIEPPHAQAATLQLVGATAEPIEPPQARAATLRMIAAPGAEPRTPTPQPGQVRREPIPYLVLPAHMRPKAPRRRFALLAAAAGALATVATIAALRYSHSPDEASNGKRSPGDHVQTNDARVATLEVPRHASVHLAGADAGVPPVVDATLEPRRPAAIQLVAVDAGVPTVDATALAKVQPQLSKPGLALGDAKKPPPSAAESAALKPETSGAKPESSSAKPARGRLTVHVDPFADVWIDGRFVKTTPVENMSLSAGPHRVRLVNEPGERDETLTITIDPAKPVLIEKNW